jgi:hypothetical protein
MAKKNKTKGKAEFKIKVKCNVCPYLQSQYEHHPHNGIHWIECGLTHYILYNDYMPLEDFKGTCKYTKTEIKNLKRIKKQHEARELQEIKKEIYENE